VGSKERGASPFPATSSASPISATLFFGSRRSVPGTGQSPVEVVESVDGRQQ
jgi:hypothetical protein